MIADAIALIPISIHAPARGGDAEIARQLSGSAISIHAPHEGGDDMLNP